MDKFGTATSIARCCSEKRFDGSLGIQTTRERADLGMGVTIGIYRGH